jgi:TetR/AcrR family transcriptional regulator, regulator of cefoperazone and chloramphenicol sensitivity
MTRPEDLTARARIRDAALALFAERGIAAATIRDIAQAAGVSSGLLRHHFGSKDGLREACDQYAMAELAKIQAEFAEQGRLSEQSLLGTVHPGMLLLQRYLVQSTMDGSPAGAQMFDRMVESGERWLAGTELVTADPRAYAATLVAMQLGMYSLQAELSRSLGTDVSAPAGRARMLKAAIEIFAQPLITPEQAAQARAAMDRISDP